MSKRKSEFDDKIEQLEAEIEQLKATINTLRRRLKKLDSKFDEDDYLEDDHGCPLPQKQVTALIQDRTSLEVE